ncbi:chemotaxis protein CheB [Rhizobium grahamii]|uniref:Blue-light-activated histidine kinase n=1 Tax=Rhizobium grahamii CCGE 502 TaxID=990285 RepID=S3HCG6_9HYPH|nr:chemotaxis protein CheB [Rhizobium grahamii]EPE96422.1 MCP methyltransferase/methylesterase [Rhizobium grahamii CCGE 502]
MADDSDFKTKITQKFVPVCAIGASAGGISALQTFFRLVPPDLGLAFVVIVHLAPDEPSALSEILSMCTRMPVREIDHAPRLKANCVFVIPPDKELVIDGDSVSARPFSERRGRRAPIDMFFRSVAAARGDGVAIVLSGAGSDGALGVTAIKEAGGVIMVQEPAEAGFNAMPQNAIATGAADFVAPIARLVERLAEVAHSKEAVRSLDMDEGANDLRRIVALLRTRTGHDFSAYKRATVMRRVIRRMQVCGTDTLADYTDYLLTTPEEAQDLFSDLLISVTMFFRDEQAFEALSRQAIKPLFDAVDSEGEESIRVWVVGCATGEEAYSIAILLHEEMARRRVKVPLQIFATDLDEGALAMAREGRYPRTIEADVSQERLSRFFIDDGSHYRVRTEVRESVLFAKHSVLKEPPFMRLDLITCRNLLIYLERALQAQVCSIFQYSLRPGRYLFLGSAETVDVATDLFAPVDRQARIYSSRPHSGHLPPILSQFGAPELANDRSASLLPERATLPAALHLGALEQSAPASALVDDGQNILHLSPSAGRFILHSAGPVSKSLTAVVRPELRLELGIALTRALEKSEPSVTLPTVVVFEHGKRRIAIQVTPINNEAQKAPQALVFFLDGGVVWGNDELDAISDTRSDEVRRVYAELKASQEALMVSRSGHEALVQELRAANEELQSMNEEYRSTAEELETSKEELQSINEELHTVNAELKSKLESISAAHSDLQNLSAATEIGTLFLDPELRIKMFTAPVAELFNITKHDIGRAITDFTHQLDYDNIETDARKVLAHLIPIERSVGSLRGNHYSMRLRPYRTVEDRIDGTVVTFVDTTDRTRAEIALWISEDRLRQFGEASQDILWIRDAETFQWSYLTPAFEVIYGLDREAALRGNNMVGWLELIVPEDREVAAENLKRVRNGEWVTFEYRIQRPSDGGIRWLRNTDFPIKDDTGRVVHIGGIGHDITEIKKVEEALAAAEVRQRALLEGIPQLVWRGVDGGQWTSASPQWTAFTGQTEEDSRGTGWLEQLHPDDREIAQNAWLEALESGGFEVECRIRQAGTDNYRWFHTRATPVRDATGGVIEWLGTSTDVDDLRGMQARQEVLVAELQHRTRNLLGVVRSMADKTGRASSSLENFRNRFRDRLEALARVQGLLSKLSDHDRVSFDAVVETELSAMGGSGDRVTLEGPRGVRLRSSTVQTLAMAIHELATNAIKYGALGQRNGKLCVTWALEEVGPDGRPWLHIDWLERGVSMPPAGPAPLGTGQGRELIEHALPYQLGAETRFNLGTDGVHCTISLPVSSTRPPKETNDEWTRSDD